MARDGGLALNGAGTYVPANAANSSAILPFACVKAINGNLVLSAVVCMIDYSSIMNITLAQGEVLYTPGCTSVTVSSGQGVAIYQ